MAGNLTLHALLICIFLWMPAICRVPEAELIRRRPTQDFSHLPLITSSQIEHSEKYLLKPGLAGKETVFREMSFNASTN